LGPDARVPHHANQLRVPLLRLQVGHVDEQLFGEVSELLCLNARKLPRSRQKGERRTSTDHPGGAAGYGSPQQDNLLGVNAPTGRIGILNSSTSTSTSSNAGGSLVVGGSLGAGSRGRRGRGGGGRGGGGSVGRQGGAEVQYPPNVLHAGTVARAMWAFAMMGLHDDPVLPLLMPHARVRCACLCPWTWGAVCRSARLRAPGRPA